jgi:hypothetical protein
MAIRLEPHTELYIAFSARLSLARIGFFKCCGAAKMAYLQPKNPIFHHFRPKNPAKNGSETAKERL